MKMTDILKKYVLPNLPYFIFLWFFAKVGEAVRLAKDKMDQKNVYAVNPAFDRT